MRPTFTGGVIRFPVRLTPKGGRDAVEGWETAADGSEHLKVRVRAVPENGKANTALIAVLADTLGVPKSAIRIVSGATSRLKRLEIAGDSAVLARLEGVSK
jgi:uncharacterized protein